MMKKKTQVKIQTCKIKSKTKPKEAKDKNTKCAKQKCKQIFIVIKYENVNSKGIKQTYETRSYLKFMLID